MIFLRLGLRLLTAFVAVLSLIEWSSLGTFTFFFPFAWWVCASLLLQSGLLAGLLLHRAREMAPQPRGSSKHLLPLCARIVERTLVSNWQEKASVIAVIAVFVCGITACMEWATGWSLPLSLAVSLAGELLLFLGNALLLGLSFDHPLSEMPTAPKWER